MEQDMETGIKKDRDGTRHGDRDELLGMEQDMETGIKKNRDGTRHGDRDKKEQGWNKTWITES